MEYQKADFPDRKAQLAAPAGQHNCLLGPASTLYLLNELHLLWEAPAPKPPHLIILLGTNIDMELLTQGKMPSPLFGLELYCLWCWEPLKIFGAEGVSDVQGF